jgi:hypothetical protein
MVNIDNFFAMVKSDLINKIKKTPKAEVTVNAEKVISEFKNDFHFEALDIDWENFKAKPENGFEDRVPVDNYLLAKGYAPGDMIRHKVYKFSTKVIKGNPALFEYICAHVPRNREFLNSLEFDSNEKSIAFSVSTYGPDANAELVVQSREKAKKTLQENIDFVNRQLSEHQRRINELVDLEINLLINRYKENDKFFDAINNTR